MPRRAGSATQWAAEQSIGNSGYANGGWGTRVAWRPAIRSASRPVRPIGGWGEPALSLNSNRPSPDAIRVNS